jgi:hypothetical protein
VTPTSREVFDRAHRLVRAYDIANGNFAFVSGRLRISRDGALLFATVTGGVAIYGVTP